MSPAARRALLLAGGAFLAASAAALLLLFRVDRAVTRAAAPEALRAESVRPLGFEALSPTPVAGDAAGDGAVLGVAEASGELLLATGSGLEAGGRTLGVLDGLPSLRVGAVASWRGTPVFALERGGWGRLAPSGPERAVSGFDPLEVRSFAETDGGELLLGARQGLFRASFASGELEKLDDASVLSLALLPTGEVAVGGESGLRIVAPGRAEARLVATPDRWVSRVAVVDGKLWVATATGAALGPLEATTLTAHPRGADAVDGVAFDGAFRFVPTDDPPRLASLLPDGTRREVPAPERFRRLFVAGGQLLADGPTGLRRHDPARGFELVREASPGLPAPHVNALAADGARLWLGFFDGGLATADPGASPLRASPAPSGGAWGVNAILPVAGVVWAATLRGAFRIEGEDVRAVDGAGAAFALAQTTSGLAIGYGQGVLLPARRLLSAWHGLPGNQAYALAADGSSLWVGTPTGLGRVERQRVAWRVLAGEGKLPHPWVTALFAGDDGLFIATYGGGIAVRRRGGADAPFEPFPETRGLRVNAGALLALPDGRLCAGTQGSGLWCSDRARTRFARLDLPLPSPDVFSLAAFPKEAPEHFFAGTSEGLLRLPADALPETR